ncbi:MAG: phosphoribosylformylglycinamidine cyclo-ligase [Defluviitaleaceae bacterium]|nr:phosphoribosylformylglycinamidine cyclo-ligase [Defluviitaleaceae bacterium]
MSEAYKAAGVDVHAGYEAVALMKKHIKTTMRPEVISGVGGFASMFSMAAMGAMAHPVLVSSTDGVGTKLKIAQIMGIHDTVGIDLVAMCVNDLITSGAQPLFFLDYIACGKVQPAIIEQIVKGVADGCRQAGAALVGGETAEHPGMIPDDDYDLAGFSCGIIDKDKIIDGKNIKAGDLLIGIGSSGLHSNGFSLVRKILGEDLKNLGKHMEEFGCSLGEELLRPTIIYVDSILQLIKNAEIKGFANITGGGFFENIPRMIPEGVGCEINLGAWPIPPVFDYFSRLGDIHKSDMFATFNMGCGMVACVAEDAADGVIAELARLGQVGYVIGRTVAGSGICLK